VEEHDVGGVTARVFSAAKTVADCFKFFGVHPTMAVPS
jgi:hypothetical protein